MFLQRATDRKDELPQQWDQAGVEGHRRCPTHGIEARGQLMTTGDRQASQFLDQSARSQFVGRVSYAKVSRDGESLHLSASGQDGFPCGCFVQGFSLIASFVVAATQIDNILCHQFALKAVLPDQGRIVANKQQTDRAALPLDDGVGGQRRRKRHQTHLMGWNRHLMQNRSHRLTDADGQIVTGCQGLGAGQNVATGVVHQDGVGVRTSCVNAQGNRHAPSPRRRQQLSAREQ